MKDIQELDSVVLLKDYPERGLFMGDVGCVLIQHDEKHYEIEFPDEQGQTRQTLALPADDILRLNLKVAG